MKSQPGRKRWVAGALRAGRAAAFLTLATGINGTIAALEPRYEPIYVYLAAIVIVAWLGGALLGVTTAVAAVILYDTMFAPVQGLAPSWSIVPLLVAIAAAVVTQLARAPLRRSQLSVVTPPPLLETTPPKIVSVTPTIDAAELEDLRQQLADAGRQLDEARGTAERESRVRVESAATARARLAGLQHELDASRNDALEQARRAAALHAQLDEATGRDQRAAERQPSLAQEVEAARHRTRELEARLNETTQELEVAWRRVDEEKGRSDAEAARLQQMVRQANEALQKAVTDLAARYEQPLAEAKTKLAEAFTRIPGLESERDAATAESRELRDRLHSLQREMSEHDARSATIADSVSRLEMSEARSAALNVEIERLRGDMEDARSHLEIERAHRQRMEGEVDRKIASIAAGLTSDYEESLGQAMVEKEAARAEVRSLTKKVDALQNQLAEASKRAEAARLERERLQANVDGRIAGVAAGLASDHEESLGQALREKEGARGEISSLTSKVDALKESIADYSARLTNSEARAAALLVQVERLEADAENHRSRLEIERAERERLLGDFDRKLSSIVTGITDDHEHAIGEALVEREAARAELRSALKKVEAEKRRADDEKAAREKLDADWGARLQTIVNHLASDHESDLGEKMMEREAARAEARDLSIKLKSLQQKLALEREQHRQTAQMLAGNKPSAAPQSASPAAVVLVVHSDAGVRAMSRHALEQSGYTVITAADGLEGLRVASSQRPDVVLAEAIMPKMNGRELVQLLKARGETAGVKVVLMNGAQGANANRGSDFQADDVLDAPVDFNKLRDALAKVLTK